MEDTGQNPALTPKANYRGLKRRFKYLVYENECYQEELRNLQRKLLKLSRDKNFLLDRLMSLEKPGDSSDESDSSVVTRPEETKKPKKKSRVPASRKRPGPAQDPKRDDGPGPAKAPHVALASPPPAPAPMLSSASLPSPTLPPTSLPSIAQPHSIPPSSQ